MTLSRILKSMFSAFSKRNGLIKKFLSVFVAVLLLTASAIAVAEVTDNLLGERAEEYGPDGCSKSMEPVEVILINGHGYKTIFRIPKAYLTTAYEYKSGIRQFIHIKISINDFMPACLEGKYTTNDSRKLNENFIDVIIKPSIPEGYINIFNDYKNNVYTSYLKTDELGFRVFRSPKKEEGRIKEFLTLPENYLPTPSFIECTIPSNDPDESRSRCAVWQAPSPYLLMQYYIPGKELNRLKKIDAQISNLISQFIVNKRPKEK